MGRELQLEISELPDSFRYSARRRRNLKQIHYRRIQSQSPREHKAGKLPDQSARQRYRRREDRDVKKKKFRGHLKKGGGGGFEVGEPVSGSYYGCRADAEVHHRPQE